MKKFKLVSEFHPRGDQPKAIRELTEGILKGIKYQTLLGVTGSGKTFTIANVIEKVQRPVLVISHNKTLAAQLYSEFKAFFPENAVEYFVSYYDYYQPEAYVPQKDLYIEKDASINRKIEKFRLRAMESVLTRRDVIVVSSVSCIYGLSPPEIFRKLSLTLRTGNEMNREEITGRLVEMQYERNDYELALGRFRVRGEVIEIYTTKDVIVRVELFDDEIERIEKLLQDLSKSNIPRWMFNRRKDLETGEDKHLIGGDVKLQMKFDIDFLKKIRCYRGIRHELGLKVRGQRTKSTGRKGGPLGVIRRKKK